MWFWSVTLGRVYITKGNPSGRTNQLYEEIGWEINLSELRKTRASGEAGGSSGVMEWARGECAPLGASDQGKYCVRKPKVREERQSAGLKDGTGERNPNLNFILFCLAKGHVKC